MKAFLCFALASTLTAGALDEPGGMLAPVGALIEGRVIKVEDKGIVVDCAVTRKIGNKATGVVFVVVEDPYTFLKGQRVEFSARPDGEAQFENAAGKVIVLARFTTGYTQREAERLSSDAEEFAKANERDSRIRAIKKYPGIKVAGSPINLAFVAEYRRLLETKDPLLKDPRWPEKIADRVANLLLGK